MLGVREISEESDAAQALKIMPSIRTAKKLPMLSATPKWKFAFQVR
jgi:hypothetical protein